MITNGDYSVLGDAQLWRLMCDVTGEAIDPFSGLTQIDRETGYPCTVIRFIDGEVRSYNPPSEIPS